VDTLYQTLLHRAAEPAGRAGWINFLLAGGTEAQAELLFLTSAEYLSEHQGSMQFVVGLYADVLRRAPAAVEVAGWVQAMQAGVSPQAVAWGFLTSVEGTSDALQRLYLQALRRGVDPAGLAYFSPALQAGAPLEIVADNLFGSAEYYNLPH
jgi:hypothetical protein